MTQPTDAPSVFAKYRKAVAVVVVTVASFVVTVLTDGITPQEWVLIAGVGVNAAGVAVVPNLDAGIGTVAKTVVSALLAGLTLLATAVLGGLTPTEVIEVLLACAAAVGVTALPNDWPPARQIPPAGGRVAA